MLDLKTDSIKTAINTAIDTVYSPGIDVTALRTDILECLIENGERCYLIKIEHEAVSEYKCIGWYTDMQKELNKDYRSVTIIEIERLGISYFRVQDATWLA